MLTKYLGPAVLLAICWSLAGCEPKTTERPLNVLFILADDMGPGQLGCYGSTYYETPYIDRLAKEGMRFTQAYSAAAVCSPTRAALMTGKSPAQLHLTDFIPGNEGPEGGLQNPDWRAYLPLEELTLGERFKALGYHTALFGKWHLSTHKQPPESLPFNPDQQGFDEYMVTYKPRSKQTDPEHDPHNVDSITDRGIEFLKAHQAEPFFLMLSHNSIHDPLMEAETAIAKYEQKGRSDSSGHPVWGAMVERLDRSVGRILAVLDSLNLSEHTLVVFYGDNGAKHAYASQYPLRAGKGWLYEGGIRVPLIMKMPGSIPAGSTSEALVTSMDFTPTLLQAIREEVPESIEEGISFSQELGGKADRDGRQDLFWHYPHYHRGSGMQPAGAMRRGDWKLIEWYDKSLRGDSTAYELYHLRHDPGESRNLAATEPDTLARLLTTFHQWRKEVGAQMPVLP